MVEIRLVNEKCFKFELYYHWNVVMNMIKVQKRFCIYLWITKKHLQVQPWSLNWNSVKYTVYGINWSGTWHRMGLCFQVVNNSVLNQDFHHKGCTVKSHYRLSGYMEDEPLFHKNSCISKSNPWRKLDATPSPNSSVVSSEISWIEENIMIQPPHVLGSKFPCPPTQLGLKTKSSKLLMV